MQLASGVHSNMLQIIQAQPSLLLQEPAGEHNQQVSLQSQKCRVFSALFFAFLVFQPLSHLNKQKALICARY